MLGFRVMPLLTQDLTLPPRLASSFQSSCLNLPSVGIINMHHHAQLSFLKVVLDALISVI